MPCAERERLTAELLAVVQGYGEALAEAKSLRGTAGFNRAHERAKELQKKSMACQDGLSNHEAAHDCSGARYKSA